jgi:hypothetical protein
MTEKTKITLSAKELELVCNKEWILTKQIIIGKVCLLFGQLAATMQSYLINKADAVPYEVKAVSPKISKGENYLGLPYVMLDYPRFFTRDATLAIRTFFWWGNFFSINLQMSGKYMQAATTSLKRNFGFLQQNNYSICINTAPWHHHFETDNYVSINNLTETSFAAILSRESFIKIAKQINLQHWDAAGQFLEYHFNEMVMLLGTNFPTDERDLSPGIPKVGFDL